MIFVLEKICCFCGHEMPDSDEYLEKAVAVITDLVENHGYNAFFSGHAGGFDIMCENIVRKLKKKYPHIRLYGILTNDGDFDEIINLTPKKLCEYEPEIAAKNRWMAERSDLTLCCVYRYCGHAWQMKKYAEKIGRRTISIV